MSWRGGGGSGGWGVTLQAAEPVLGCQEPTHWTVPPSGSTTARLSGVPAAMFHKPMSVTLDNLEHVLLMDKLDRAA